jgi:hypothetical protein
VWLPVPEFDAYEVSDAGLVCSLSRIEVQRNGVQRLRIQQTADVKYAQILGGA